MCNTRVYMQTTCGCVPVNVTQRAFKSIFMCSAPYVAALSLPVLMSCQSQHHSRARSDTSFIFPVLLLICLFFLFITGWFLAPKDFLPVFSDFYPASISLFLPFFLSLCSFMCTCCHFFTIVHLFSF